ncbi:MAG: protein kinase domain-containing protein [Phycisphaerae bacterium]
MTPPADNLPPITDLHIEVDDEQGPFRPGQQVDQFTIGREIGRGGMCFVYQARDTRLDRRVAIKALRPSLSQSQSVSRRFFRESVMVGNLSHPNIVPVFSQGHADSGTPYFAMEFVDGQSIADRVAQSGPLGVEEAIDLARQACDALAYAHAREIIHRDITPRNILLDAHHGRARLVDFGVAQDSSGRWMHTTAPGGPVGTVGFMSPEQNLGRQLDERSDIFSLGLVIYFMLTGRCAWQAENRAQLALAYQMKTPAAASHYNPSVPQWLDELVLEMLATNPDQRPQSCREILDRLRVRDADTRDIPVATPRTRRRRSRKPAAALAFLGCIALAGLVWLHIHQISVRGPSQPHQPGQASLASIDPSTPRTGADVIDEPRTETQPQDRAAPAQAEPESPGPESPEPAEPAEPDRPLPDPKPTRQPDQAPVQKPLDKQAGARELRAEVMWVYQPKPTDDFEASRARSGRAVLELTSYDPPKARGYAFDDQAGLVAVGPDSDHQAQFHLTIHEGQLIVMALDADGPGRLRRVDKRPVIPRGMGKSGPRPAFALKPFTAIFVECTDGAMAQLEVQRIIAAVP